MSKSLTDDWKAGKLKWHASYYCINPKGEVVVATLLGDDILYSKELGGTLNIGYWEVLAPIPSYDQFVELTEKVKELEQDVKTLTNNYKLLEDKQASDIIHGQALVDEFGDFEALYEELQRLKEVIRTARDTAYSSMQDCPRCGFIDNLLTKALNESEKNGSC
jgi:hypothetical protein